MRVSPSLTFVAAGAASGAATTALGAGVLKASAPDSFEVGSCAVFGAIGGGLGLGLGGTIHHRMHPTTHRGALGLAGAGMPAVSILSGVTGALLAGLVGYRVTMDGAAIVAAGAAGGAILGGCIVLSLAASHLYARREAARAERCPSPLRSDDDDSMEGSEDFSSASASGSESSSPKRPDSARERAGRAPLPIAERMAPFERATEV